MKQKYVEALLDMAERFGQTSTAERLKVGALIVKNGSVISLGINGMPPKWPTEVCEDKEYAHEKYFYILDDIHSYDNKTIEWLKESFPYEDEEGRYKLVTKKECRHAEVAALEKLWGSSETSVEADMFVSHSPCPACCIKIKTAGIKTVYYRTKFRSLDGLDYLIKNGVEVIQVERNRIQ